MDRLTRTVVIVAGPTASGKSACALALAERLGGVVINADSMQVYRELEVLTARPGPEVLARAPHRLYGVLSAAEWCSAGRWLEMAVAEIEGAFGRGSMPVVVGGTGLYLKALIEGLAAVPRIPAGVRREARARHRRIGARAFHDELGHIDPAMAARLEPGDSQRVLRAFEVMTATGRSLLNWQRDRPWGSGAGPVSGAAFAAVVLLPPRDRLYGACDRRFLGMIEGGALDEAARLLGLGFDPSLPVTGALGLRPLWRHLAGEIGLEEAIAEAQRDTRRYAKRQETWLRTQLIGRGDEGAGGPRIALEVVSEQYSERLDKKIFPFIRHFLLTEAS